ncbi:MAG: phospholipase D-like domain-containing protein [bacterium]
MRVRLVFCNIFCFVFVSLSGKQHVLFSPDDNISEKLITTINNTKKNIYAAIYMFTDKKIALALIEAKNQRGVDVQVITDQSCLESKFGKVDMLKNGKIDIFVYKNNLKNKKRASKLMHNKFAIFDNEVCTGSFNWTIQANKRNKENLIFIDDQNIYKKYCDQFELLKKKCMRQAMYVMAKKRTNVDLIQDKTRDLKDNLVDLFKNIKEKLSNK